MVTAVWSLAVPENEGAALAVGDSGGFSVTVGGEVSTMNVTGWLLPAGFPIALVWVASAVNVPLPSARVAWPEVQLPGVPVAVAVARTFPSG